MRNPQQEIQNAQDPHNQEQYLNITQQYQRRKTVEIKRSAELQETNHQEYADGEMLFLTKKSTNTTTTETL